MNETPAQLSWLVGWLRAAVAAFQFLTRLPLPYHFDYTPALLRRSTVFYPLVGGSVGLLLTALALPFVALLSPFPAAVFLLILWVGMTGALHMDGLMDTADGLLSYRPRERMLEIMKDSRVGAMGAIAGALVLLGKASLLYVLLAAAASGRPEAVLWLAILPVWSRWFMTTAIAVWPNARGTEGMGAMFKETGTRHVMAGWLLAVGWTGGALALFPWLAHSEAALWLIRRGSLTEALTAQQALPSVASLPADLVITLPSAAPLPALFLLALPLVITLLTLAIGWPLAERMNRKLGGLTGDTYGALNELLELMLLTAAVIFVRFL